MISKLLTAALLLFVTASIACPLVRKLGRSTADTTVNQAPLNPNRVMVFYFHTRVRCPACRMVEASSRSLVETKYSEELINGQFAWQSIDYQSPGNQHYVEEYQLLAPSVVLVEFMEGNAAKWKTLNEVWSLTGDRAALEHYIDAEIRAFRKAAP
jgi:hypothetical protein